MVKNLIAKRIVKKTSANYFSFPAQEFPAPEFHSPKFPSPESSADIDLVYRESILDHYKHPRNNEVMKSAFNIFYASESNPLCGDMVTAFVKLKGDVVERATFTGHGCAISQASASMLTEFILKKKVCEVFSLSNADVLTLLGIEVGVVRMKCAMLALFAFKNALRLSDKKICLYINNIPK